MMSDEEQGASPEDTAAPDETTEAEESAEQVTAATQDEARGMGWVPQDEWRGDPDTWRGADEFVQRGKEILPIVRSQVAKRDKQIDELKAQLAESSAALRRVDAMSAKSLERQKQQLMSQFEAEKVRAVEVGDTDAYKTVSANQAKALKELDADATEQVEGKRDGLTAADNDLLEDWQDDNTWFKSDTEMTNFADRRWNRVERDMPNAPLADKLSAIREAVEAKFPDKFGKPLRKAAQQNVEGGSRIAGNGAAGKLSTKLPRDVRSIADRDVKAGLYKSVEDWADVYFSQDARQ
jgi:small-conductance mechanosensitive channel